MCPGVGTKEGNKSFCYGPARKRVGLGSFMAGTKGRDVGASNNPTNKEKNYMCVDWVVNKTNVPRLVKYDCPTALAL